VACCFSERRASMVGAFSLALLALLAPPEEAVGCSAEAKEPHRKPALPMARRIPLTRIPTNLELGMAMK